ncbi:Cadmium, cobalt and zinc/H(+)-K(+) antiporter [Corynebacterium capitovis DSM 44611]|uniref:cation diffusion facilitator family transporter n=1 Tax=Corynebacterium capitovis TaxID=131081 RepID=UPI000362A1BB|nr:cation diffusion facilitator family transporter [Corynebacterium capitovis]WKD57796.1 Cadmium, cobalt and zinc/H(+)-K(+) antiporter [Corynebacterium capitovis DSM 44611]
MAHEHHGAHGSPVGAPVRALATALSVTAVVFVAEVVGGVLTGSMALVADAVHMLSDAAGLTIAVVAVVVGRRAATAAATYGYRRAEVLAALLNATAVLAISLWIVVEAVRRFGSGAEVAAGPMMIVAAVGLVANVISALVLQRQRAQSINVEGAFLHVMIDMLSSVAVLCAGVVIAVTGFQRADAIASFIIAAMILPRAWQLMRQALRVLLEQVPHGFNEEEVGPALQAIPGVQKVHDLHVWSLDGAGVLATAHLVVDDDVPAGPVLDSAQHALTLLGIRHSTIQIEAPEHGEHEDAENVC